MQKSKSAESIEAFKRQIAKSDQTFLALSPIPALKTHIQFLGRLADTEVLWDATVQTLASHLHECQSEAAPAKKSPRDKAIQHTVDLDSFMLVDPPVNGVSPLKVVLPVPMIDEPTLRKTIIMIRCYKRLKVGYHKLAGNA
jgi:hypothetical protein